MRSVTITKVHAPGMRRSTFWVNHSIDRRLAGALRVPEHAEPLVACRPDPVQVLDRGVDAQQLVVAGHDLDQAARSLDVGDEVLDQVE